ncbi:MAG: preprotein translocase subunit SecG [Candidatus Binatia bacterium]
MYAAIVTIHILSCIFLILVVLLQTGKGADMGAVFGGSSSTVFGSSGAGNFLTKLTTATAVVFMLTSLGLTYYSTHRRSATVFDSAPVAAPAPEAAPPVAPAPPAPAPEPQSAEPPVAPAP